MEKDKQPTQIADQTVTKCNGLKMPAADGKMRLEPENTKRNLRNN